MFDVLFCSASPADEFDICETSYDADRSAFCFWMELKADEQIIFLKSFVNVKVDSFSGNVIIRWDRFLFKDSIMIRLS